MTDGREAQVLTLAFTGLTAVLFVAALGLGPVSAAVPLTVAAPTLVLFGVQLVTGRRRAGAHRGAVSDAQADAGRAGREAATFGWMLVLIALVWALGVAIGLPAYLLFYLRLRAGHTWFTAFLVAAGAGCAIVAAFELLLNADLPAGAVAAWLSRS